MYRFLLLIVVSLLATGASGIPALVVSEPCGLIENQQESSGECLPTCATCGCCSQPLVSSLQPPDDVEKVEAGDPPTPAPMRGRLAPNDVFHVPKPRLL